ncbi:MAG: hypothetical protein Q9217_001633 [Psora testacea]
MAGLDRKFNQETSNNATVYLLLLHAYPSPSNFGRGTVPSTLPSPGSAYLGCPLWLLKRSSPSSIPHSQPFLENHLHRGDPIPNGIQDLPQTMNGAAYGPDLSLTADQEGLLLTALSSNPRDSPQCTGQPSNSRNGYPNQKAQSNDAMTNRSNSYTSPEHDHSTRDQFANLDDSPLFENYDLEDGNYEWDNNGDQLFADVPGNDFTDDNDIHDKRKASTASDDGEIVTSKRQEGDGKTAKKPGRKLLTAEPTTKRKAQNRAAQRAFRERKERHLKDLETKVDDLEKASESTNHENGRLRAQVEKLNMELKEYRKRLSLNSTAAGHSPPLAAAQNRTHYDSNNDFQFAFPKFGDLPGASFLSNGSMAKTSTLSQADRSQEPYSKPAGARNNSSSSTTAISPTSSDRPLTSPVNETGTYQASPNGLNRFNDSRLDGLTKLFSPSILETASRSNSGDYMSYGGAQSTASRGGQGSFSSNSGAGPASKVARAYSASTMNSPGSSMSHAGLDSSYGSTPESSVDSPDNGKASEGVLNTISEKEAAHNKNGGKKQLCDALATACGNTIKPVLPMLSESNNPSVPSTVLKSPVSDINGIDWMAQQNGGQFDPVLFGDYRDPQDNILNTFDDFFNDAFPTQDFASPYNTGDAPTPEPKRDLMKEIQVRQDGGEDEVVPAERPPQYLECDKLWSAAIVFSLTSYSTNVFCRERVQASEKYKSGGSDMDDLCSQLKSKAKCSGKEAVIEEKEVDRILGPPSKTDGDPFKMFS